MSDYKTIDQMYAFVCDDFAAGMEGVVGANIMGTMMPLVGADMTRIEQLKPIAAQIAKATGKKIKLVTFTVRSELETFG